MSALALRARVGGGLRRFRALLRGRPRSRAVPPDYWEARARRHGARAVLHLGHSDSGVAAVTELQRRVLLPLFAEHLRGDEACILDLGCGPGRFCADIARQTGARVVGLDPTAGLLALAPHDPRVAYLRAPGEQIPVRDGAFDAVWVCQVLGGIVEDAALAATAAEIRRVLRKGGLLFLVENTTQAEDRPHWRYRDLDFYRGLFGPRPLDHLRDYEDLGERNSVLAGCLDG